MNCQGLFYIFYWPDPLKNEVWGLREKRGPKLKRPSVYWRLKSAVLHECAQCRAEVLPLLTAPPMCSVYTLSLISNIGRAKYVHQTPCRLGSHLWKPCAFLTHVGDKAITRYVARFSCNEIALFYPSVVFAEGAKQLIRSADVAKKTAMLNNFFRRIIIAACLSLRFSFILLKGHNLSVNKIWFES